MYRFFEDFAGKSIPKKHIDPFFGVFHGTGRIFLESLWGVYTESRGRAEQRPGHVPGENDSVPVVPVSSSKYPLPREEMY